MIHKTRSRRTIVHHILPKLPPSMSPFSLFLKSLPCHINLPSAAELESFNFDVHSEFPEFSSATNNPDDRPIMSFKWLKNMITKQDPAQEKMVLPTIQEPSSGRSSSEDLESLTSSDASTLLDEKRELEPINERRNPALDARIVSDAIIGLSDGLTVPFALTAGLSALGDTKLVIYGGVAELIAGAISMGLGGYLGAKSEE